LTSKELIRKIYLRLGKFKLLILAGGLLLGAALYLYAKRLPVIYSSRASVFPLTATSENSIGSSALSSILGISEAPKSFSQEASINIVELATSRRTREAVARTVIPQLGNKSIARLIIEGKNKGVSFLGTPIKIPAVDSTLIALGANILGNDITAKINKNGILELSFSNPDYDLISPVTYTWIDKISQFYKDMKIKKARFDYDFTVRKLDSLELVLNGYDKKAIHMANTTLFVPGERIEFTIPKENLINDKERVLRLRDASENNKEEALWRLQKVTPIIETLDKPDPPFTEQKTSAVLYGFIGFILGCGLFGFLLISGILYKYVNAEINEAVFGDDEPVAEQAEASSVTNTTSASTL
jgi:hypothetical protein